MNRRGFLARIGNVFALTFFAAPFISRRSRATTHAHATETLATFLDTLLPADDSPSASMLNIQGKLTEHASNIHNYPELLALGCQWLDKQAQLSATKSFSLLAKNRQIKVVELAEKSKKGSIEKLFFDRIRQDAFTIYYSQPESWKALGISAPPQPMGYLNHSSPPIAKS